MLGLKSSFETMPAICGHGFPSKSSKGGPLPEIFAFFISGVRDSVCEIVKEKLSQDALVL